MKNYKMLSRNALKYIALIAMTIDHTAFLFVAPDTPLYFLMRTIGRLTAPIMCFFIAEGFRHTRNRKKYFSRLALFALISQPFYFLMIFRRPPENAVEFLMNWNVMFTFCLSFLVLLISENKKMKTMTKLILKLICFAIADLGDWSYIAPIWVLLFYKFRENPKKRNIIYICLSIFLVVERYAMTLDGLRSSFYQFGILLAPLLIGMYNGKSGSGTGITKNINRWVFYVYYPLHMAVLVLLNAMIK